MSMYTSPPVKPQAGKPQSNKPQHGKPQQSKPQTEFETVEEVKKYCG